MAPWPAASPRLRHRHPPAPSGHRLSYMILSSDEDGENVANGYVEEEDCSDDEGDVDDDAQLLNE